MGKSFIPYQKIEQLAADTLRDFQRKTGNPIELPIDIDIIGELLYGIVWEYALLDDPKILAALFAGSRTVKINELHAPIFKDKSGFERFTKAHEIGHWILHVDQAVLGIDCLPGLEREERILCRNGTKSAIEHQADYYAASLLMPTNFIIEVARTKDLCHWPALYAIAESFDVTITALKIRLERLGLIYVSDDGVIHRSKEESHGQQRLF